MSDDALHESLKAREPTPGCGPESLETSADEHSTGIKLPFSPPSTPRGTLPSVPGYEILEEIGRGGMGVIYRARDRALNRIVAVKLLQERFESQSPASARFIEEAQITGQLQHPGIPPIYFVGKLDDGRPFLAMKLIKGHTLLELLKSQQPINLLSVIEGVAQAVGYAHAHQVIHRDLKPANVMVGAYGEVQVMD